MSKTINDFTDAELAAMVRNSIYAKNTLFGGPQGCRFLLVMAVPYGQTDDGVESLPEAIEGFHRLLSDPDWDERDFQVYDHEASQHFFSASMQEVEK
jgi:hypothetical protein